MVTDLCISRGPLTLQWRLLKLSPNCTNRKWLPLLHVQQWRQLGAGGRHPQDSPIFFLLAALIQCSIYVHAYQALVHFSI